jgi:hypothetical protein
LDKAPTRPKSARRTAGVKEETIGRKEDGSMKSSTGDWGKRQRRIIGQNNRNGSSSRDQSDRKGKRQGIGSSRSIRIGINTKFKHGRMVSRQQKREPHVLMHLNVEGGLDLFSQLGSTRTGKTEKGMDVGGLLHGWSRGGRETEIKRKMKRATGSWNAANNVGAVNSRTAIPGTGGSMSSFGKDGVGATIVGGDGNDFAKEPVKVFNANSLVVAVSSDMNINIQNRANRLEKAFESTAVIDDDQAAETNFQKDFLNEKTSEIMSGDVASSGIDEDKTSEIAHGIHEAGLATVVGNVSRSPEIDVEDAEGTAERPRKDKLAVASNGAVGGDTVGTLQHPSGIIMSLRHSGQKKRRRMQCKVL